jgi:hypothetical protein
MGFCNENPFPFGSSSRLTTEGITSCCDTLHVQRMTEIVVANLFQFQVYQGCCATSIGSTDLDSTHEGAGKFACYAFIHPCIYKFPCCDQCSSRAMQSVLHEHAIGSVVPAEIHSPWEK